MAVLGKAVWTSEMFGTGHHWYWDHDSGLLPAVQWAFGGRSSWVRDWRCKELGLSNFITLRLQIRGVLLHSDSDKLYKPLVSFQILWLRPKSLSCRKLLVERMWRFFCPFGCVRQHYIWSLVLLISLFSFQFLYCIFVFLEPLGSPCRAPLSKLWFLRVLQLKQKRRKKHHAQTPKSTKNLQKAAQTGKPTGRGATDQNGGFLQKI